MPAVFGFHEVFHALVIAAGLIFYVAIARVIVTGLRSRIAGARRA